MAVRVLLKILRLPAPALATVGFTPPRCVLGFVKNFFGVSPSSDFTAVGRSGASGGGGDHPSGRATGTGTGDLLGLRLLGRASVFGFFAGLLCVRRGMYQSHYLN